MALVRNGLSMKMKGRAGSFSFYSSKGRQVVRVAQNSTNYGESARRSEAQQVRRVKWANLVNMYKLMGQTLHGAFETKRSNETDYNAFMRKNLPIATVALTKEQAATNCVVVQEFTVSEGSLPKLTASLQTGSSGFVYVTNIKTTANFDFEEKEIAEFSTDIINKNSWAKEGMQISILVFVQDGNSEDPHASFTRYEVTLNKDDHRDMVEIFGDQVLIGNSNGLLQLSSMDTDAYVAVILSDSTSGQLKVSTSTINAGDNSIESEFSSDEQVAKAMESYGVDASRFLDSGDYNA